MAHVHSHTHTYAHKLYAHTRKHKHTLYKGRLHASYPGSADTGWENFSSRAEKWAISFWKNSASHFLQCLHNASSVRGRKEGGGEEEQKEATTQDWPCSYVWCTQAGRHPFCTFKVGNTALTKSLNIFNEMMSLTYGELKLLICFLMAATGVNKGMSLWCG